MTESLHLELQTLASTTAREAAAMVLGRLGGSHRVDTKSSDIDLVTEVDQASEVLISERLLAARPHDGIVGEEGTGVTSTSGVDWLVDPIDGTTSFFYGLPGFSVSIAARVDDQVVAGVVLAPSITHPNGSETVAGTEYAAALGGGATMNGTPIRCRDTESLSKALVGTGFSSNHAWRERQGELFASIIPKIRDIRRTGSAALDLACVAAGQLDAFFEIGLSLWDYAAGALIAQEAGALTIVEPHETAGKAFVAAASPNVAEPLFALLRSLGADSV